ncbi:hypothetical protein CCH79_00015094, partial [Gambusia affinis]
MELSAAGDRIFAAEAILKRRVRKLIAAKAIESKDSTWEPEENILDDRLILGFEQKEREREMHGPKKRGPKPKNFAAKGRGQKAEPTSRASSSRQNTPRSSSTTSRVGMAGTGEGKKEEADYKRLHSFPLIRHTDMPEEMRVETMELCVTACEKFATNNE